MLIFVALTCAWPADGRGLQSPYIPRGRRLLSGDFYISLREPASTAPFGALAIPILLSVGGFAHGVAVCEVLLRLPQDSLIKPFLLEYKMEVESGLGVHDRI